jgi:hypothetical protein
MITIFARVAAQSLAMTMLNLAGTNYASGGLPKERIGFLERRQTAGTRKLNC